LSEAVQGRQRELLVAGLFGQSQGLTAEDHRLARVVIPQADARKPGQRPDNEWLVAQTPGNFQGLVPELPRLFVLTQAERKTGNTTYGAAAQGGRRRRHRSENPLA